MAQRKKSNAPARGRESRTKTTLRIDGERGARSVRIVSDDADYAIASGACPHCKASELRVQGSKRRISADDRAYEADGGCLACGAYLGLLRHETETLFGVREDEAVMRFAGVRIY